MAASQTSPYLARRSHTAVKMKMKRRDVAPGGEARRGDGNTQTPAILLSTAFINFRGGPPGAGKTITRLIRFSAPSSKICKAQDGEEKTKQTPPPPKKNNPNLAFV